MVFTKARIGFDYLVFEYYAHQMGVAIMTIMFMMPNWSKPSEVWLQRMLLMLEPELGVVIANDTNGEKLWNYTTRAISLSTGSRLSVVTTFFRHGLRRYSRRNSIVLREADRSDITHILCHYGAFAVEYLEVWQVCKKPLFVHFHGYDTIFDIRKYDQPDVMIFPENYIFQLRKLSQRATFIANSEFTKSKLVEAGLPADGIVTKYLGVPIPVQKKAHWDKGTIHIVHLGNLVDCKSPDRTIKAFERVRSKGIQAILTIAGDGPLRVTCELLKARSPYKDTINFLGAITSEHAQDLLASADIFTQHNIQGELSRQSEAFGVSILEAMANGLPVVGTRHGGVMETVVDKETGFLVAPGNVEEQAEAIIKLAQDASLRQRFGDAGRQRVSDYFSLQQEEKRLREIMQL